MRLTDNHKDAAIIEKLLTEVPAINQKYELINQKTGAYFNIFDIIGASSDEVVICNARYYMNC